MALRIPVFSLLLLLVCSLLALSGAAPADDKGRLLRDGKPKVYVDLAAANATSRPENQTSTLHQNETIGTSANQSTPAAPMPPRTVNVTDNPRHHVRILAKRDNKPKSPQDQQAQQQQGEQGSQSFQNATFPNATTGAGTGMEEQRGGAQSQTAGGGAGRAGGGFGNATFPNATTTGGQQQQRGGGGGNATTSAGRAGQNKPRHHVRILAKRDNKPTSPQDQQAQQQQGEQGSQSFENATFPNATTGAGTGMEEQRGGAQSQTAGGGAGRAGGGFGNATFPNATTTGGQQQQQRGGGGGNATTSAGRAGGKRAYRLLAEVTGIPSGRPTPRGNTTATGPGTTRPRTSNTTATAEEESGSRANTTSTNRPRADRPPPPRTNVTSGPTTRGQRPSEPRDDPV